jgi:hypothetical protein
MEKHVADEWFDIEAYVDAATALLGLPIDPAHRPGIVLNLRRIADLAALVMEFPLSDDIEAAPVFEP